MIDDETICVKNSVAVIGPSTISDPVISTFLFTRKPSASDIDAVADPSVICDRFSPVTPDAGIPEIPLPSPTNTPLKDPVKEPVVCEPVKVSKLEVRRYSAA